jgi:hypothetical protein
MIAFSIVTDLYRTARFIDFEYAHPGTRLSCDSSFTCAVSPPPYPPLHRPGVVHQPIVMGLQLFHRIWRHLDRKGG